MHVSPLPRHPPRVCNMATRQCLGMNMRMPLNHTSSLVDEWGTGMQRGDFSPYEPWSKQLVRVAIRLGLKTSSHQGVRRV